MHDIHVYTHIDKGTVICIVVVHNNVVMPKNGIYFKIIYHN